MALNWFQRAFPGLALKRMMKQEALRMLEQQRASGASAFPFEAVAGTGIHQDWRTFSGSADSENLSQLSALRSRVRHLERNNVYVARMIKGSAVLSLGRGLRPQSKIRTDTTTESGGGAIAKTEAEQFQRQAEYGWERWTKEADATGKLHYDELLRHHLETIFRDGEVYSRDVNLKTPGRFIPYAIQTYEAEQICTPSDLSKDPKIRDGHIIGSHGETLGYWVRRAHPGETASYGHGADHKNFEEVPAKEMRHLGFLRRPGQTRYYTCLAPALIPLGNLHKYWEAELVAARVAACYVAFIKKKNPKGFLDALPSKTQKQGQNEFKQFEYAPGRVWMGEEGDEVNFGNPNRPNSAFGEFSKALIMAAGLAVDLPYILLTLDYSQSNYSNTRSATQEAREHADERRDYMVGHECEANWSEAVTQMVATNRIMTPRSWSARQYDWLRSKWLGPDRKWIDPEKEGKGVLIRLKARMATYADELAKLGLDWEEHFKQVEKELEVLAKMPALPGEQQGQVSDRIFDQWLGTESNP